MPELLEASLGRFFLAFGDLPAVDHDVMFIRAASDLDGAEGEIVKLHTLLVGKCCHDSGKSGPALLEIFAATVRVGDLFLTMLCNFDILERVFLQALQKNRTGACGPPQS